MAIVAMQQYSQKWLFQKVLEKKKRENILYQGSNRYHSLKLNHLFKLNDKSNSV